MGFLRSDGLSLTGFRDWLPPLSQCRYLHTYLQPCIWRFFCLCWRSCKCGRRRSRCHSRWHRRRRCCQRGIFNFCSRSLAHFWNVHITRRNRRATLVHIWTLILDNSRVGWRCCSGGGHCLLWFTGLLPTFDHRSVAFLWRHFSTFGHFGGFLGSTTFLFLGNTHTRSQG